MKKYLKTALILFVICAAAALLLAVFNSVTAPKISAYEAEQKTAALKNVSGGASIGEYVIVPEGSMVNGYYTLDNGGYILNLTANGYGGPIILVASYSADGILRAAQVISNSETPGLGKKSEESWYMDKFIGKGQNMPIRKTSLSDSDAQAVSGASMTFTGISKALLAGSNFVATLDGGKN